MNVGLFLYWVLTIVGIFFYYGEAILYWSFSGSYTWSLFFILLSYYYKKSWLYTANNNILFFSFLYASFAFYVYGPRYVSPLPSIASVSALIVLWLICSYVLNPVFLLTFESVGTFIVEFEITLRSFLICFFLHSFNCSLSFNS